MKKKIYACTAALFLSAAALAACSGQSGAAAQTQPIAAGQETVTAGSQDTALNVTPSESAQAQTPAAGDSVEIAAQPSTAASAFISEADAKKAAFDHAGVTEADVTGLRVKLDYDDGRQVYDVEFYSGNQEYDYEISATDGTVLSFDQEMGSEDRGGLPGGIPARPHAECAVVEHQRKDFACRVFQFRFDTGSLLLRDESAFFHRFDTEIRKGSRDSLFQTAVRIIVEKCLRFRSRERRRGGEPDGRFRVV